jgi:hypothetical protein
MPETRVAEVEFDERSAFMTFDALERAMLHAAQEEEMEIAAEYLDTLFLLQTQAEEITDAYHDETDSMLDDESVREEQEAINAAILEVKQWAIAHKHDVAEWFAAETEEGDADE